MAVSPETQIRSPHRSELGTRPAGARDEGEAARQVREMFGRIAPRYDFLNHLLSFSFDRLWRRRVARRFRHILARPGAHVLDLCCGTGDLALAFARAARSATRAHAGQPPVTVLASDFAHPMLVLAQEKITGWQGGIHAGRVGSPDIATVQTGGALTPKGRDLSGPPGSAAGSASEVCVRYVEADALLLPFPDSSFDLVAAAFGFRNLANYERGLREMYRLLKPGGELAILEFAEPRKSVFAPVYRFYFKKILPRIGGAISGSAAAYAYLPSSVAKFPSPEELSGWMAGVGFLDVHCELWTGGIVALHTARRA